MGTDGSAVETERRDVVVVGGGIAGLSTAWHLRELDVVVLEAADQFGGRIQSIPREDTWLNFGAHVFGAEGTATGRLVREIDVATSQIPGQLASCSFRGRFVRGRLESYPFRLPMSMRSRLSLTLAGLRLQRDVASYARVLKDRPGETPEERQAKLLNYKDNESFAQHMGPLPEDVDALFRCTITRSTGDPEQVSAGYGIGFFHMAMDKSAGIFSHGIWGGSSALINRLASLLPNTETNAEVTSVEQTPDGVRVTVTTPQGTRVIEAAAAVVTTQSHVTARIVRGLPQDTSEAMQEVRYGPFALGAFLVNAKKRLPWEDVYAVATPMRSFAMLYNTSSIQFQPGVERPKYCSVMVYCAATQGARLLQEDDDTIAKRFRDDFCDVFPGIAGSIEDLVIKRWERGSTYPFPGRGRLQPALTRDLGHVYVNGDYLGTKYVETAISRAESIACQIRSRLSTDRSGRSTAIQEPTSAAVS